MTPAPALCYHTLPPWRFVARRGALLPTLEPFIGLRYDTKRAGPLQSLITPPYDVISPAARREYAALSPYNFVHLILPEGEGGAEPAAVASIRFAQWREAGILVPDPGPRLTLHRQTWTGGDGRRLSRTGLIAALQLDEAAARDVRPHERTLAVPKSDRLRLTLTVGAHLSPVFLLAPDRDGQLEALLSSLADRRLGPGFMDRGGVTHQVVVTGDEDRLTPDLDELLRERPLVIADGHHRYEAALACRDTLRSTLGSMAPEAREASRLPIEIVSAASPGLLVLPYHRLLSAEAAAVVGLCDRLRHRFGVEEVDLDREAAHAGEYLARCLQERGRGAVAIVASGESRAMLLHLVPRPGDDDPVASLDVSLLHRQILEAELGLGEEEIRRGDRLRFTPEAERAIAAVRDGGAQAAFLLNPTSLDDLARVTAVGLRMPQKSTYFHPKVPAGLVIHPFS